MQVTAPLALVLGSIGLQRDARTGPAIAAVVIGGLFTVPVVLQIVLVLAHMFGAI